ncbi:MAG: hypothetical protein KGI80_04905 [Verrucomicrobiota bacterium]|nr:hypothetical protein [Verrucomicrobiota bacterium]
MQKLLTPSLLLLLLLLSSVQASENTRIKCIDQLRLAFELQTHAKSYEASCYNCALFNCAEEQLAKMREPKERLIAIRSLWLWYRMYGYSCGLLQYPVQSPDEYIPRRKASHCAALNIGTDAYTSADPKQQRCLRDFLLGVGMTISGVFCVTVNPPVSGPLGIPLIFGGFGYMWSALNELVVNEQEKQIRLKELQLLRDQAEKAAAPENKSQK